jgi:hypothetical protein
MIETPLSAITFEEIKEPEAKILGHTLSPMERLNGSVAPLQRLRYMMNEDTYEEVVQIWAYKCLKADGKYAQVNRVGGVGDKGRDVIAYLDDTLSQFDLYQCKHYDHELNYSDLFGEIGKLLTYTFLKAYPTPKHYFILCPYGLAQSFRDLLQDDAKLLKAQLLTEWDTKVVKKVGKTYGKKLDPTLKTYIESFDYGIVKEINPLTFVDEFREKAASYFFWYFGGGLNSVKKAKIEVPSEPKEIECNYISNLYEAYTEHAGEVITQDNISDMGKEKYYKHLDRSRSLFYAAEEIRLTSRQSTPPESDEFDELKSHVKTFIGNTYDDEYPDGFTKVKKVVEKAGEYKHAESLLIGQFLDSNAKQGVCHHLSNEGVLTWKTKE